MKKIISASIIVVAAVLAAGFLYLKSFIPDYDEQIAAPGLHGKVSIERNRFAVPTIEAQGLEDLYFAWGYVNAQDRMLRKDRAISPPGRSGKPWNYLPRPPEKTTSISGSGEKCTTSASTIFSENPKS